MFFMQAIEQAVTVGRQAFLVRTDQARAAFWARVAAGHWEPQTFRVLDRYLDPACSYIDIGAWIGPTLLYGAGRARMAYALEPDPVAFEELSANLQANPALAAKSRLFQQGVAARAGTIALYAGGLYWSDGSSFGDSMSGMLPAPGAIQQPQRRVSALALDEFMRAQCITDCGLIKMDIEGGEYSVISGAWRRLSELGMPALYVSFHAPEPELRESLILPCLEELQHCYRFFRAGAELEPTQPMRQAQAVRDWADEDPQSPWKQLERLLGQGLLANHGDW
jgi:FkbM family methyltransferase